jgi:predicted alpha/beta superfamily hydrolase
MDRPLKGICMRNRVKLSSVVVILSLALVVSWTAVSFAQEPEAGILTLGHTTTVYSRVLAEERTLLIDLPTGYELTQTRFPVLFLLDGLTHFHHATATVDFLARDGRIPQMIIVGIPNVSRTRDLTPTQIEDRELSGGGENFLKFIEEELIPYIDDKYRTQPHRVLFGHSLAGMFSIYSLLTKPDLFGGYIAASPYLQYDDGHVVGLAESSFAGLTGDRKSLFITLGDEPDYTESIDRLVGLLDKADKNLLRWEYKVFENDDHGSVSLKSLYQGLEMIFSSWLYSGDLAEADVQAIEKHFSNLSDEYGYQILIPEALLNQMGYLLLADEKYDEAIAAFELNISNYPESANVYDSLGEGYEAMNKLSLAKINYEKAHIRAQEIGDPNTRIYKLHLDALLDKLSGFD